MREGQDVCDGDDAVIAENNAVRAGVLRERERERRNRRNAASAPRRCIVCGTEFRTYRKNQRYCGRRCMAYAILLPHHWKSQTESALNRMTENRLRHPLCGPFESNCRASYWSFLSPDGVHFQFRNASNFVREHVDLFLPEDVEGCLSGDCLAAHQMRRLRPERKHPIKSWKGWTWMFVRPNSHMCADPQDAK